MDFDFSPDQIAFRDQVEAFLDANDDPIVFDVTRENMAQVADIPERRALMGKVAEQGRSRIGAPGQQDGSDARGQAGQDVHRRDHVPHRDAGPNGGRIITAVEPHLDVVEIGVRGPGFRSCLAYPK